VHEFLNQTLNGGTSAGLVCLVGSGFTLIFGLMRVVNMAHGAFFLLGGYIALKLQRAFVGQDSAFGLLSSQVRFWEWLVPWLIAAVCIASASTGFVPRMAYAGRAHQTP